MGSNYVDAVKLPETASWDITLENIYSISVFKWQVRRIGCRMYGKKEFQARQSKNSLVDQNHLHPLKDVYKFSEKFDILG